MSRTTKRTRMSSPPTPRFKSKLYRLAPSWSWLQVGRVPLDCCVPLDHFLAFSDGIWDNMSNREVMNVIQPILKLDDEEEAEHKAKKNSAAKSKQKSKSSDNQKKN